MIPLLLQLSMTMSADAYGAGSPGGRGAAPDAPLPVAFRAAGADLVLDLHGDPAAAELVIYLGGNYYFLLPELIAAFTERHPELAGRVFYETLPPEIVIEQIRRGGRISLGNLTITAPADVLHAGKDRLEELHEEGLVAAPIVPLGRTDLAILVRAGNPTGVQSLLDLGRPGLRLANPNPDTEGIAKQIQKALRKAGGQSLERRVYDDKIQEGVARLTEIHHRQTPSWIRADEADAGVVWSTEARYHTRSAWDLESAAIAAEHNVQSTIGAAIVARAPHSDAARKWLRFLESREASVVFRRFGFAEASAG